MDEVAYFRRRQFYGEHNTTAPKWHITANTTTTHGTHVALCGYSYGNARGDLLLSTDTPPHPRGELCAKCESKLPPATSVS